MKLDKGPGFWGSFKKGFSRLRNSIYGLVNGRLGQTYKVDSSRVDYEMARSLYNNTNDAYKLGAGFARPIVNTIVGFMGLPHFTTEDESAQPIIDEFFETNTSKLHMTMRNAVREGDCYVQVTREKNTESALYPEKNARLVYRILPPEMVKDIVRNPLTGEVSWYDLESIHEWEDEKGAGKRCKVMQRISATETVIKIEGDLPPGVESHNMTETNTFGFISIVEFKNESDEHEEHGRSELEAVEPYMKAYHDVMIHAIQGNKMHSTPKLKLKVNDVAGFLLNNFGIEDPVKHAREGKSISLEGREALFLTSTEDAEFIEVRSSTGDATKILEFLFYCIVDVSEMPEFAFGVHTPSSLASVKEQMPILIRRIGRKRAHFDEPLRRLVRIVLAMTSAAEMVKFKSYSGTIGWDDIDPRDGKEIAEELELVSEALDRALRGHFISQEAAVDFFSDYVDTMNKWDDPEQPGDQREKRRIMMTRLRMMRLEDSQMLEEEDKEIDEVLKSMIKGVS